MRVTREWYTNARPRAVVLLSSEPRAASEKVTASFLVLAFYRVSKEKYQPALLAVYTNAHAEVYCLHSLSILCRFIAVIARCLCYICQC